jgi:hypothetical protein
MRRTPVRSTKNSLTYAGQFPERVASREHL